MKPLSNVRKFIFIGVVGIIMLIAANADVSAQSRRQTEQDRQRIERENARYQRDQQRRYRGSRTSGVVTRRTEQNVSNANYANGYQQGLQAGEYDRRGGKYNRSNVYRDTGASPNQGDPSSSDYIYRQGYLQGYSDGFNGVRNY